MKKLFKTYAVCWAILFVLFNIVCFVIPNNYFGISKFGGAFWSGYIFITLAFIGQIVCAYFAFKAENLKKLFYNLPLVTVSYTGLILTIIFGTVFMAIPNLPNWIGIVVCIFILAFNAVAVVKASTFSDVAEEIDEKIKTQTQFIKLKTVDAQNIMNRAKNDNIKQECKKVYEALRYSDPMSSPDLSLEEAQITVKMAELKTAVDNDDNDKAISAAKEIILLVKERNAKCKALK